MVLKTYRPTTDGPWRLLAPPLCFWAWSYCPLSVKELASIYTPLVEQLKQPFNLLQLFDISNKMDLPHPHLSIKYLQEAGVLVPQGDGTFTWDKQKAT